MPELINPESLYAYAQSSPVLGHFMDSLCALGAQRVPPHFGLPFVSNCLAATTAASIFTVERLEEELETARDWGLDFLKAEISGTGDHTVRRLEDKGVEPIGVIRLLLLAIRPELYPVKMIDAHMARGEGLRITTLARRYNPRLAVQGSSPTLPRQEAVVEEFYAGGVQFTRTISLPAGGGFGREIFKIEGKEVEAAEWKRKSERLANRPIPPRNLRH